MRVGLKSLQNSTKCVLFKAGVCDDLLQQQEEANTPPSMTRALCWTLRMKSGRDVVLPCWAQAHSGERGQAVAPWSCHCSGPRLLAHPGPVYMLTAPQPAGRDRLENH